MFLTYRDEPTIAHNYPPIAGAISWCKGLLFRINNPMSKLSEMDEKIMEALKGADAVFAGSMEEFGKSDANGEFATASDKLDALVKSYMDENKMKKSQYAIAYAEIAKTDEGRALINKSYKGD